MRDPLKTAFGTRVHMPSDGNQTPANGPVIVSQLSPEELERYRQMGKPGSTTKEGTEMPAKMTKEQYLLAVAEGKTDAQIAAEVGWTPGTLSYYRSKWQVTRTFTESPAATETQKAIPETKKTMQFDFDVYEAMREEGKSQPEIAKVFGMKLEDLKARVGVERAQKLQTAVITIKQHTEPSGDVDEPDAAPEKEVITNEKPTDTASLHYAFAEQVIRFTVKQIAESVYQTALEKGWHDTPTPFPTAIALIHSEVSEALEADRKGKGAMAVAEELADVVIRVMDTAEAEGLDLAGALFAKMQKNREREWRHGGLPY